MGKGRSLTTSEKAKIDVYHTEGYSNRDIAKKLGRSPTCVDNYLKNPSTYGKKYKGRKATAISAAERRRILRCASNSSKSISKIKHEVGVEASKSTVRRVILSAKNLKLSKLVKKPPLTATRKDHRLQYARNHMDWTIGQGSIQRDWRMVVFTDEKKFNLDGPDGYNFYFHDLRKEKRFLTRHHSREGGVMVWGAISYFGALDLSFQNARMTGSTYKGLLEAAFPKITDLFGPLPWILQQDNAPIHTAGVVKSFIASQNVQLMSWPPYSPDLNIIENAWGWLTRKIYEGGKQYNDKEALIDGIKTAWADISLNYLKSLYDSLPNRIYEVISQRGGYTHY